MLCILALFFLPSFSTAQQTPPGNDSTKVVEILSGDKLRREMTDTAEIQIGVGHIRAQQGTAIFECDSFYYNKNLHAFEAFGHVHINDADSIHTYSDYLLYHTDTRFAYLNKNVKLTNGSSTLYTTELDYDMNQHIGNYYKGGKVVTNGSVLTSREGTYYADLKDVYFKDSVRLKDPKFSLRTDSLLYNSQTQIATFITQTYIQDSVNRNISTREGYYDLQRKKASFGLRPIIKDGATTIIADHVKTDDSTGISILTGNAVFTDTAQGTAVLANYIITNRDSGTFMATRHPLLIIKQDKDSIYVTGDTLYSGRLSQLYALNDSTLKDSTLQKDTIERLVVTDSLAKPGNDTAARYFQAFHHVRIYSDSLQAVSDSLFYSGQDSAFRLFKDPVVWNGDNQLTGDTIYLYTKNKKADRLYVSDNGLIASKVGDGMYNQIKGNRINGYFTDGNINYMRAQGNAESLYYVADDQGYLIGVNKAACDIIDMRFQDQALYEVVLVNEPTGTLYPFYQMKEEDKLLRNFHWYIDRRPKTKYELFGD